MKISQAVSLALLLVSVLIIETTFAAKNDDFALSYAERVTFTANSLSTNEPVTKRLTFSAFRQTFDLFLTDNLELMSRFPTTRNNVKLYTGTIAGKPNTWARISVTNGQYSGAIFNGKDLYLLDAGDNIDAALTNNRTMRGVTTVIYRASDASTHLNCGNDHDHRATFAYESLIEQAAIGELTPGNQSNSNIATARALEQINLRIVADTQYAASGPDAQAQVISQINIVDGIFSNQVGVQFGITSIEVLNDNGPLTSTDASTLLRQFNTFVGSSNPGLAHLFTGRDIDSNTIGIAFLRAICRSSGAGLTQAPVVGVHSVPSRRHTNSVIILVRPMTIKQARSVLVLRDLF